MKPLSVDQVRTLRNTQATWRAIAENPSIRLSARENAARNVAIIEAQLAANLARAASQFVLRAFEDRRHG